MKLELNELIRLDNGQVYCVVAKIAHNGQDYYVLAGISGESILSCFATLSLKGDKKVINIIDDTELVEELSGLVFDSTSKK